MVAALGGTVKRFPSLPVAGNVITIDHHNGNLERVDGAFSSSDDDRDGATNEPLPAAASGSDCDGDGYSKGAEDHAYSYKGQITGDQKTCQEYDSTFPDPNQTATPSLRWPSDFITGSIPDSTNRITIGDLSSFIAPVRYNNTYLGTHPGDVRWDVVPGGGGVSYDINILDQSALIAGPSGYPPMLGGERAFSGPPCPWPP